MNYRLPTTHKQEAEQADSRFIRCENDIRLSDEQIRTYRRPAGRVPPARPQLQDVGECEQDGGGMKPRLLDLFCGAGGAGMGYHRAGFDVVGVDIRPMPRYPFEFHQADALEYLTAHGHEFDAIHASPPCQRYSVLTNGVWQDRVDSHPGLIAPVRELLIKTGKPYVIENVEGARKELVNPLMLCGSMFKPLEVFRHRYFETNFMPPFSPASCKHDFYAVPVYGHSGAGANRGRERERGRTNSVKDWARAMNIDWMTGDELAESIPPAYTEYIGKQLLQALQVQP